MNASLIGMNLGLLFKINRLARKPHLCKRSRSPLWNVEVRGLATSGGFLYPFLVIFFENCPTSEKDQTLGLDRGQRFKEGMCVHTGLPSSIRGCYWNPSPGQCSLNALGISFQAGVPRLGGQCGESCYGTKGEKGRTVEFRTLMDEGDGRQLHEESRPV